MADKVVKDRLYWIDAVRSFACLCVICTHAAIPNSTGKVFVSLYNYFSVSGASILFFMISGALVLYKPKPPVQFLKKRLSRIVFPMVFWTIVTLFVSVMLHKITFAEMGHKVLMIPFAPQVPTYWFIYVIFGIYLMTPILATWLERCEKKDLELYLGIWGVTLLLPYLNLISTEFNVLIDFTHGYLYYFFGYLWYAVMGYYIRRYVNITKLRLWHMIVVLALFLLPGLLYLTPLSHDVIQSRMAINMVALCVVYFVVLKHIHYSDRWKNILYDFAQHSFGIYLVHALVVRRIVWPILAPYDIHYAIQVPLITLVSAAISYLIVHLFSKLPYSKYIVGL